MLTDLPVWAGLVGHDVVNQVAQTPDGPWWFVVAKVDASTRSVFSGGQRTPVGHRLWVYTNFSCNLACTYCCAESSPRAPARQLGVETATLAFAELAALGGREVLLTGGEPFLHPDLGALVAAADGLPRTRRTNAMR